MSLTDKLTGYKILAEVNSPINGKLTVISDLAWGVHIKGGGLTQSGGVAATIWKSTLKHLSQKKQKVANCLILGLGAGGIVKTIRKAWKNAVITGVDIDPVIVDLGRIYMQLDKYGVNIIIADSSTFLKSKVASNKKYDLVCVDMYVGDNYPKKFTKKPFMRAIKKLLTKDGVAVFNRLYYGQKRIEAVKFGNDLEKVFKEVIAIAPEANIMFLCKREKS